MKVLTVANVNPDKFGSFEKYLVEFTKFLMNKGHEHHVLFSSEPISEVSEALISCGAYVDVKPFKDGRAGRGGWQLLTFVRSVKPDIVHTHFYPILCLFSFLMLFSKARFFATYHMSGAPAANRQAVRALKKVRWWIFGASYRRIFCVSRYNREKFINDYRCPHNLATVVYNAVNQAEFGPIRVQRSTQLKNESEPVRFISVAYLIPEKGIQDLIEACRELQDRKSDFHLSIVGSGPFEGELHLLVRNAGLDDKVTFLGQRNDVPDLLAEADVAVIPSIWEEAFGYTVVEAMSSGLAVIATRVGGIPEIIMDGHDGLLIPKNNSRELANAMVSVIESSDLRRRFSENCVISAMEKFGLDRMFDDQLNYYF